MTQPIPCPSKQQSAAAASSEDTSPKLVVGSPPPWLLKNPPKAKQQSSLATQHDLSLGSAKGLDQKTQDPDAEMFGPSKLSWTEQAVLTKMQKSSKSELKPSKTTSMASAGSSQVMQLQESSDYDPVAPIDQAQSINNGPR